MAYKGNGSSQYLLSGTIAPPATWSFHFWYKGVAAPSNSNNQRVFNLSGSGPTVDFGFLWNNTATPQTVFTKDAGGTYYGASLVSSLSSGTWYGIGGTLTGGGTLRAILNGTVEASTVAAASPTSTSPQITLLAAYGGASEWDDGTIAEVALWNTGLTQPEFTALGAGICPLFINPQSLLSYAPLLANVNSKYGATFTNFSATSQEHCRIYYPTPGETRRITALTPGSGSEARNVNFQSVFHGGVPGIGWFGGTANFSSSFKTKNPVARNVNFQSVFSVPAQKITLSNDVRFRSRFVGTTGVLATGRFRGRFYG